MIPDGLTRFETPGERQFYEFLRDIARPQERFLCWYQPDVSGLEPDFLLFGNDDIGIIIFEIKDWGIESIEEMSPDHVLLRKGNRLESVTNPLSQADHYGEIVREKLRQDPRLVYQSGRYQGKLKIPVNPVVVFPNISTDEFKGKEFDRVITPDRILFLDDLHPNSEYCRESTGSKLAEKLLSMRTVPFDCHLTGNEFLSLRQTLYPVVRVAIPERPLFAGAQQQRDRLRLLDLHQESIARDLGGGHRLIRGPSGSGKSLVLAAHAALLHRFNPGIKRILLVCYNITLVNYLRRLISMREVPLGEGGVEVLHFYELCSKLLGDQVPYEKETPDYYDYIVKAAGEMVAASDLRYDAILVDEGQDYSDEMYFILMGLLNPLTNHLVIAIDESQTIYGVRQTWKQVGIKAGGRVKSLRWVYRNTEEIASFANRFMGNKETSEGDPLPQLELPGTHFRDHGPHPELVRVDSLEHESSLVADRIAALVREGIPASEIAVLYTTSQAPACALPLPKLIERDLAALGVLSRWASEDYRAKRSYDITSDSVTVSTIHSVKGMDFAFVFLVGVDCLAPGRWTAEQLKNLVYVGITRARHGLVVPYATESDLVRDLKAAL